MKPKSRRLWRRSTTGMPIVGRLAALGAVIAAAVLVAMVLFDVGAGGYEVTARFVNAGQVVKGNPVQTGGAQVGTVKGIDITDDGRAAITLSIDDDHAPLREGTRAAIKQLSLSGIANRYVELSLPPNGKDTIEDGGLIEADKTRTAVELDQLFNTIDPKTRKALQGFLKGNARQFRGTGTEAGDAFHYLNPALATSSRLFNELARDKPVLERFLVDSSRLVSALAERRDDLSGLVGNLNETTRALGSQKAALSESIEQLPPFMRRANTTFVNLRAALDDVDPLVDAAEPVAARLDPFLDQARGFAADAEPTVRDLRATVKRRGSDNDLVDFIDTVPRLTDIAVESKPRHGAERAGAFPEGARAFRSAAPIISEARPYTTDFLGWLDDFSTTGGGFDAQGAYARAFVGFGETLNGPAKRDQFKRCPGSAEEPAADGSNVLSEDEQRRLDCQESARATGDVP